jgi:hypothetical protein
MLVLRGFKTKAQWSLDVTVPGLSYCDEKGALSTTAVAAHPSGVELAEALSEGWDCELLSWKTDKEEPLAAMTISQALNMGNEISMRSTELTALAAVQGEIVTQQSRFVGQAVAYNSVLEAVGQLLGSAAFDPDLRELYEFCITLGVGTNTYVPDLLEFVAVYVLSSQRQLRFSAFGIANKLPEGCPLLKVAVIKRAYRKDPKQNKSQTQRTRG